MEIQILGPLSLARDGTARDVGSARVRTVLAMLSFTPGTALSANQLVDELWPDRAIGNTRNALQANVVRLRKLLESVSGVRGDILVRTTSVGYLLDVPADAVDAHRFLDLAERGARNVTREPELAVEQLESALRLWRGPALFDVAGGHRCQGEATLLDERRLAAREDLIAAKLATGGERVVVSELKQLVAEHPERERFSEQLMIALYRSGRQAEAVDVFHYARKWLDRELGLEPGRPLRQLYHSILNQDQLLSA
ncbi:MAG: Transcriptional regulator, family [Amycolatopsis sp.]|jgi:DNA-binding SARP family transcriptional activator|uniref:AfsR/SARP family transcriptional regulator n=1 Tax=Amycolatopsis sp. TaxID=37632 RepID=UPI00263270C4|nr:AfsR/SARP family transcriptional regulator [Amycolatopsis sp.]MCU1686666.1 Transcriptional regulator, family [Amycolatopsis sp.]